MEGGGLGRRIEAKVLVTHHLGKYVVVGVGMEGRNCIGGTKPRIYEWVVIRFSIGRGVR